MIKLLNPRRSSLNEDQLFIGLRDGNAKAFDQLYSEHRPKAAKVLLKMNCPNVDIDDIFQDSILALWQNIQDGTFAQQDSSKISTYLIQICRFKFIDRTRKLSFSKTDLGDDFIGEIPAFLPKDFESIESDYARLDQAFSQLGDRCQEMLTRFYFKKESLAQLAAERGITPASAKNEKYRCIQRLKKSLETPKSKNHD